MENNNNKFVKILVENQREKYNFVIFLNNGFFLYAD